MQRRVKELGAEITRDLGFDAFSTDEIARTILAYLGLLGHVDVNADEFAKLKAKALA